MDIERPLYWHQGLFLQPQHFQLLDLSYQTLLTPFRRFMGPHFWGVAEMEIQKAALGRRSFSLANGNFLFPDGSYVAFPGNALLEGRPFDEAWVEGGKPFPVYIGTRKWKDTGENVTVLDKLENLSEVSTRFVTASNPEETLDLHSGGPKGQVKRLHYVLKIFWEKELDQLGDYILIPVAELERMGEEIRLSERYVPPCLTLSSSEPLARLIKDLRDQIAARSHQLEELKRQRGIQTAEFGSRDMVYLLALRSLNRYVPVLFHFTEASQIHPWPVYGALRQMIGELSTFSERVNVLGELENGLPVLLNYDHRNLWECFSTAQALVIQLLDEITAGPDYMIRLLFDGTYFATDLKPAIFEGRNSFYLALKTEEDPKVTVQSIATVSKFGARESLPMFIARALPGIRLDPLTIPPQELPRRAKTVYFAVDHHSQQWAAVAKGQNIALYWDSAPEDLEVELMVVGR